ncbi:MAG: hypothetical protein F6K08_12845, partial [Okeania sp. SIO1H6]|nr:hypothetical protein [Okeania sp. SIO1H6]
MGIIQSRHWKAIAFFIGLSQTIFVRCRAKTIAPYYLVKGKPLVDSFNHSYHSKTFFFHPWYSTYHLPQMNSKLFQQIRILDPVSNTDRIADVLIIDSKIAAVETQI